MKSITVLTLLLALMSQRTSHAAALTNIPMISGAKPALNGNIEAQEWSGAVVLQGAGAAGAPATHFYLQHDGTALWVAIDCEEPRKTGPVAQQRGPLAELSIDDAVEVAIGLPGGGGREISMGGYDGAMSGKVAPMAQLYEFIVNAEGSLSRKYDEAALPTPRFEAKVSRGGKGWRAEFRIPFDSLGLKNAAGREIYLNLVRFRHPGTVAWRGMNKWGGYRPFPAALVRLAASPTEPRTLAEEDLKPVLVVPDSETDAYTKQEPLPLNYFPLSNTVVVAPALQRGEKATLTVNGKSKEITAAKTGAVRFGLQLPARTSEGAAIEARLETRNARGELLSSELKSFKSESTPAWAGTDAGQEYANNKVPSPWKAPVVAGEAVRLEHGVLTFGNTALPRSMVMGGQELLARPSTIYLWQAGKKLEVTWSKPTIKMNGVRPVVQSTGAFGTNKIEVRTEIDYDGFTIVQIRLQGKAGAVNRIQLVYPLKTEFAQFIAHRSVQTVMQVDSAGYQGQGADRFWLGSETGGLSVSADLPFYQANDKNNQIRIEQKGGSRELILTPADSAEQLAPGSVLQFYLQPTPVRQPSRVTRDDYNLWFEQWSDYQGYPDLKKMPEVKQHVQKSHAEGKKQLLYFNQLMAENAPGFAEQRDEIIALPERPWYRRSYEPGLGVPCYVSCVRGPYGDLLLDGIRKLANEGDIDGIYMDGTSVAWDCETPSHLACDIHRRPVWGQPGQTPILGTRLFLKRLRGIFAAKGKPFVLSSHTGGDLDINTLGLCDFFVEGEQLSRNLPQFRIPKHQYAIGYSGTPWGYRTQFHDYWLNGRGINWSLAYTLIFNTDDYGGASRLLLRPFDGETASFHPYYKDGQKLLKSSRTGQTSVSFYRAANLAMVAATNFSFYPDLAEIDVSSFENGATTTWIDVLTGKTYQPKTGKVSVSLAPYGGVALRPVSQVQKVPTLVKYEDPRISSTGYLHLPLVNGVENPAAAPVAASAIVVPELKGMDLAGWKSNLGAGGVSRKDVPATAKDGAKLVLGSIPYGSEAQAWLEGSAIGGNAELHLKLKPAKRPVIRVEFGPVDISCSNGLWKVEGALDGWNDQQVQQPAWDANHEAVLTASIINDLLTIRLDDQIVADGIKLDSRFARPRPLKVVTWSDSSFEIELQRLTAHPGVATPTIVHPVNP